MTGWVKLYRQIIESELYFSEKFSRCQAWIDLILLANHKPTTIFLRGAEVKLNRGDLGYSIVTLSVRWKWNERTVDRFLKWLESRQMIQCKKSNVTTVISILNYERYQGNKEQTTEQKSEQIQSRMQTDKNDNNEKNEENEKKKEKDREPPLAFPDTIKSCSQTGEGTNTAEKIITRWNTFVDQLPSMYGNKIPRVVRMTSNRKRMISACIKDKHFDFEKILDKIKQSSFLQGENDLNWTVDFEWILRPDNYDKILSGRY